MNINDALKVLFGACLGLIVSIFKDIISFYFRRHRAIVLLRLVLPAVLEEVDSLMQPDDLIIPLVPLYQLHTFNTEHLLHLELHLAERVTRIIIALDRAENSRKAAADLLESQDNLRFTAHATAYRSWLEGARKELSEIAPLVLPNNI
jgi:hypothetical protein